MKKHIPNLLTLGNLALGCVAIYLILTQEAYAVAYFCVLIAGVLDFLDGFVARLLKVSGELGKQLDSLADLITFGLFPGVLAWSLYGEHTIWALIFLLLPALSALRLAIFNIAENQSENFIGVPTPINTLAWIGFASWLQQNPIMLENIRANPVILFIAVAISSLLLVINFPMIAFKIKKLDKALWFKITTFLIPSLVVISLMGIGGLFVVYLIYLVSSVLFKFALRN
jgi:CDP-diacylglycerol--serine O-phosphatidyltransferase